MSDLMTLCAARLAADQNIILDGRLDEPAWQVCQPYAMSLYESDVEHGRTPSEGGEIRLLWNDEHLYVGALLVDSDVVQEDPRDQQHHYKTGDLIEVFLKPANASYYWEFYATPTGAKTAFFFPGRGRMNLPSNFTYQSGLQVGAAVDGTLNDWHDVDRGWSAELVIPVAELNAQGIPFDADHPWQIFFGRYNYSAHLPKIEMTMCPPLPASSFHHHEAWGRLQMDG